MIWAVWRKKCPACDTRLEPNESMHEIRLETSEGILPMEVCGFCADFFDGSADIMVRRRSERLEKSKEKDGESDLGVSERD